MNRTIIAPVLILLLAANTAGRQLLAECALELPLRPSALTRACRAAGCAVPASMAALRASTAARFSAR